MTANLIGRRKPITVQEFVEGGKPFLRPFGRREDMDGNKMNDSVNEAKSNGFNKDWYYSMLNLQNSVPNEDKKK